ncbi:hypothetical protein V1517DRAFT_73266 [Lipomyces orientalis]|uniref:Uncharacterized protein n=1 Tax=Lipomyces orientalis TaxID=1233043 RepID=A0ACC3TT64_9ASCO
MSSATLRRRPRQQHRLQILDKEQQRYIPPQQLPPTLSTHLLYNSSPDLSLSGSESDRYYSSATVDPEAMLMARIWSQASSTGGDQVYEQVSVPPSSPPPQKYYDSCNPSVFVPPEPSFNSFYSEQESNGGRYDAFSRPALQSYLPSSLPRGTPSLEYSEYENDDYYVGDASRYELPLASANMFPYQNDTLPAGEFQKAAPDLPALSPGSDYEADYQSDGLSPPGLSSTEDTTDFSSPELAQGKTFSSLKPHRKVNWNTAWQPILTADPVTNAKFTINVEHLHDRESRLPTKTIDGYVEGPGADGKYICRFNDCGKRFGRKYNIRTHIQTHLSDKPHLCTVCGSRFVRHHDLRRHAKTHEELKPFVCPCGKGFARQDALTRHRVRQICTGGLKSSELK